MPLPIVQRLSATRLRPGADDLPVFDCEGAGEFCRRLFIEAGGCERAGKFVIKRRESAVAARKAQHTLRLKRLHLSDERACESDVRPRVARLNINGFGG